MLGYCIKWSVPNWLIESIQNILPNVKLLQLQKFIEFETKNIRMCNICHKGYIIVNNKQCISSPTI